MIGFHSQKCRGDPNFFLMTEVMTEPEAAKFLRCSVKTLKRRRADGHISFVRDGKILYLRSDLNAYLEARRTGASKSPPPAPAPKYRRTKAPEYDVVDLLYG